MKERKMWRMFLSASILLTLAACQGQMFQKVFQEQEWSENYALAEGVECTAMEMIDGDLDTAGKALFPERVYNRSGAISSFPSATVVVTLLEKKSIRKIVIHSEELKSFEVLASMGERDDWKLIEEYSNNTEQEVVIKTSVVTDKIKIVAKGLRKHAGVSTEVDRGRARTFRTTNISEPEIQEIELYGYKEKEPL